MKQKLLNKNDYPKICSNCENARLSPDGVSALCMKKGVVKLDFHCSSYKYDPLKRVPRKPPVLQQHSPEEFEL